MHDPALAAKAARYAQVMAQLDDAGLCLQAFALLSKHGQQPELAQLAQVAGIRMGVSSSATDDFLTDVAVVASTL